MTSPLATLDANQFFISVIENYSPIFTSFVFPDQYLKPKGYSEKWPIFLETSIPSSVPKHYIAHGNKRIKRLVPHSSSAFPPEWCGRFSAGMVRTLLSRSAGRAGHSRPAWSACASWGTLCVSSSYKRLSWGPRWNPAPPENRAPLLCLRDTGFSGPAPQGLLWVTRSSYLVGSLSPGGTGRPVWCGLGRHLRPTQGDGV